MAEKPKKIDSWKNPAIIRDTPRIPPPSWFRRINPLNPVVANKTQPSVDNVLIIEGLELLPLPHAVAVAVAGTDSDAHSGHAPFNQIFASLLAPQLSQWRFLSPQSWHVSIEIIRLGFLFVPQITHSIGILTIGYRLLNVY
jgi:hypothetical protein